jgi:(2Fe-2S) ferredoxin
MMIVYPEGVWYGALDERAVDRIVEEHLVGGDVVEEHVRKPAFHEISVERP